MVADAIRSSEMPVRIAFIKAAAARHFTADYYHLKVRLGRGLWEGNSSLGNQGWQGWGCRWKEGLACITVYPYDSNHVIWLLSSDPASCTEAGASVQTATCEVAS